MDITNYPFSGSIVFPNGGTWTSAGATISTTTPMYTVQTFEPYGLRVKKLHEDAVLPTKAHQGDLGLDLYALEDTILTPGTVTKVRTGIACKFPYGMGALIRDRSSVATKLNVFAVAGVIDNQYTGEILVAMYNPGTPILMWTSRVVTVGEVQFLKGDKIAQMILTPVCEMPVFEVSELDATARGANGFGSTGR